MLNLDSFKKLSSDYKVQYLYEILYSEIKQNRRNFQVFIYNSDDEDLIEFYDVILHPEKRKLYIDKQNERMVDGNVKLKELGRELFASKIEIYDMMDKNSAEKIIK